MTAAASRRSHGARPPARFASRAAHAASSGLCHAHRPEGLAGDGVRELPPQELLIHEEIEIGGERAGTHLPLEQTDGPRVLLAPEHQFRLFLALRRLRPHGHGDGGHHTHDEQTDEERGHGVARLTRLPDFP